MNAVARADLWIWRVELESDVPVDLLETDDLLESSLELLSLLRLLSSLLVLTLLSSSLDDIFTGNVRTIRLI